MKGKRILVSCNRTLNLGGIEKALTTFLRSLDTENNEVTLVLNNSRGVLYEELPLDRIKLILTENVDPMQLLLEDIKKFRLRRIICGIWNRMRLRVEKDWYAQIMHMYKICERGIQTPGHFDCAISYSTDYSDLSIILKADAEKRVAFVHGDATQNKHAAKLNDSLLQKMDRIYSVSDRAKEKFLLMHPTCREITDVMYNVILSDEVKRKSTELVNDMATTGVTLCTVGRLSPEKGQQMVPAVARMLLDAGYDICWYLVGDGPLREEIEAEIRKHNVVDRVLLLGAKINPYPYINKSDIYVQTSFSEAYCLTVAEARILCKPIVTTDVPGIREQIIHGYNGLISEEISEKAICKEITKLLMEPILCHTFSQRLQCEKSPELPLKKLYDYIKNQDIMEKLN